MIIFYSMLTLTLSNNFFHIKLKLSREMNNRLPLSEDSGYGTWTALNLDIFVRFRQF